MLFRSHSIILLTFFALQLAAQKRSESICDYAMPNPDTLAEYPGGTKGLLKYLNDKLVPILADCMKKQDGELIASIHIKYEIDSEGKVIGVSFPKLNANSDCRRELTREILKMERWKPARHNGNNVCSYYYLPVGCLKWE